MKVNDKTIYVFDNEGETFDRFTIIFSDGDICGASEHPFHPQGFGQFNCNVCEALDGGRNYNYYDYANGTGWDIWWLKNCLKKYVKEAKANQVSVPSSG